MAHIVQHIAARFAWRRVLRLTEKTLFVNVEECATEIFAALERVEDSVIERNLERWAHLLSEQALRQQTENELRQVRAAINRLPPVSRRHVELLGEGMRSGEIAQQLGVRRQHALGELRVALNALQMRLTHPQVKPERSDRGQLLAIPHVSPRKPIRADSVTTDRRASRGPSRLGHASLSQRPPKTSRTDSSQPRPVSEPRADLAEFTRDNEKGARSVPHAPPSKE